MCIILEVVGTRVNYFDLSDEYFYSNDTKKVIHMCRVSERK